MEVKRNDSIIAAWEKDCKTMYLELAWDQLHSTYMTTMSIIPIKMQGIKLLYRWYMTPSWLYKAKLLNNDLCWKKCHQPTDYIHCWWHCPKITFFWLQIAWLIKEITTCELQHSPMTLLLHLWLEDEVPRDKEHIVTILLSLAKVEIAARWKPDREPSVSSWFDRIWKAFILLKITDKILKYTNSSYCSKLERNWS